MLPLLSKGQDTLALRCITITTLITSYEARWYKLTRHTGRGACIWMLCEKARPSLLPIESQWEGIKMVGENTVRSNENT